METPSASKELKRKFDRAIVITFLAGTLLIITAVILRYLTGNSQMILALASISCFLGASVLMFIKSYYTGKKYAVGAKKRRKRYFTLVYGENSVFSKNQK